MALRFTSHHMIHFGTGSLLVEAFDGQTPVVLRIASTALSESFDRGQGTDPLWTAYRSRAGAIQKAARRKYASGELEPDGSVFVGSADL
jgi:hypothetical protein